MGDPAKGLKPDQANSAGKEAGPQTGGPVGNNRAAVGQSMELSGQGVDAGLGGPAGDSPADEQGNELRGAPPPPPPAPSKPADLASPDAKDVPVKGDGEGDAPPADAPPPPADDATGDAPPANPVDTPPANAGGPPAPPPADGAGGPPAPVQAAPAPAPAPVQAAPVVEPAPMPAPDYKAPTLSDEDTDLITDVTGMAPGDHAALIQQRMATLTQTSGQRSDAAGQHLTTKSGELTIALDGRKTEATGRITQARTDISGAYSDARTAVTSATTTAEGQVEKDATAAAATITKSAADNTKKSQDDFGAYQTQVNELATEWQPTFQALFDTAGTACKDVAVAKAKEYPKQSKAVETFFKTSGDGLQSYLGQVRVAVAKKKIPEAAAAMTAGGAGQQTALKQEGQRFAPKVQATLKPVSEKSHKVGLDAQAKVATAKTTAEGRLKTDRTAVDGEIAGISKRTIDQLNADETAATGEIDAIGTRITGDITAQKKSATTQYEGLEKALAGRYSAFMLEAKGSLPKDGFVSAEAAGKALDGLTGKLEALHTSVLGDIDGVHTSVSKLLNTAVDGELGKLDDLVKANTADTKKLGTDKAKGISDAAVAFGKGMIEVGGSIDAAMANYTAPTKASLGEHKANCLAELASLKKTTEQALTTRTTAYGADLDKQISGLCPRIKDGVFSAAREKEKLIEARAKKAYSAMRGMGTDEDKLFDALRGMEKGMPGALKAVFKNIAGSSIDSWLVDDLDEGELKIARNHLALNHGEAARLEIADNINWYGDDEAQVEKILRGMPEADRKKIASDPEWAGTKTLLKNNLDGTDLDVTDALMANKVHRADAHRLKEKIDAARRSADHDAIHKALEGVKPEDMEKVASEFAHITGKVDLDGGGKIEGLDAKKTLAAYATKKKTEFSGADKFAIGAATALTLPFSGAGGVAAGAYINAGDQKFNKGGANTDLTTALIMNGADSVEARVARLGVESQREGGPKDVNLEKAIYADPKLQADLHSQDPKKVAAAQKKMAAEKAKFTALYTAQYGTTPDKALANIGDDKEKRALYQQMHKDGFNSPEVAKQQIKLAVKGAGTDEEAIKRALKGMHPKEIAALKKSYPDLEKDLGVNDKGGFFTELSGQDRMDVEIALLGDEKYMDDLQRFELAKKKYDWQRGDEGGIQFNNIEGEQLDKHFKALEGYQSRIKDGKFDGTSEEYEEYRRTCRYVGITAALYQERSDAIANGITATIAITGAVIAAAVTGGAASPLIAMAVAGTVGATSMVANAAIKGGRYGWEDAAKDLGVTAVNVATAGVGAKLTGALQAKEGLSAARVVATKTAIAAGSGGVNSAANVGMTDKTWDDGFSAGVGKTAKAGAKGAVVSAGTAFASNTFEASKIGKQLVDSTGYLARGTGKALAGGVGGFAGANVDIAFDAAAGDWKGTDLSDYGQKVGTETGKATIQGALEGVAEAGHHRYKASKNTTVNDTVDDEQRQIDQKRRDAEAQAETERKALQEQTETKAKAVDEDASGKLKAGDEDGAKTVKETHEELTHIPEDGTGKTPQEQSTKFEKTVDSTNTENDAVKKTVVEDAQQKLKDIEQTHLDADAEIETTRKKAAGEGDGDDVEQTKKAVDDAKAPVDDVEQTKKAADEVEPQKTPVDDVDAKAKEPEVKIDLTTAQEKIAKGAQNLEDQVIDRLIDLGKGGLDPKIIDAIYDVAADDPARGVQLLDDLDTLAHAGSKNPQDLSAAEVAAVERARQFTEQQASTEPSSEPVVSVKMSDAHSMDTVTAKTRFGGGNRNSPKTVAKRGVDVQADLAEISAGKGIPLDNGDVRVSSGRIYGRHPGTQTVFPRSGPGLVNLTQAEFSILRKMQSAGGLTGDARRMLDGMLAANNAGVSEASAAKLEGLYGP